MKRLTVLLSVGALLMTLAAGMALAATVSCQINVVCLAGAETGDGQGPDALTGTTGKDAMYGFTGNDLLSGDSGEDEMSGFTGNDFLSGMGGDDDLIGGAGADRLFGGPNDDFLYGGSGVDRMNTGGTSTAPGTSEEAFVHARDGNAETICVPDTSGAFSVYIDMSLDTVKGGTDCSQVIHSPSSARSASAADVSGGSILSNEDL